MATPTTNIDLVRAAFESLNEQDRASFVDLHTPDAVLHDGATHLHGIEAIADHEFTLFDAFPDLSLEPVKMIEGDDTVAAFWTITGTQRGEFQGIEPTGNEVSFRAMGMFRIDDGLVAEVWLLADRLALMTQLGAVDPPDG